MAVEKKNWPVDTYVDDTWTDVVSEAATLVSILVSNLSTDDIVVQMRIVDGVGTKLSTILPESIVLSNKSFRLNTRAVNILTGQRLQIKAPSPGIEVIASGVSQ